MDHETFPAGEISTAAMDAPTTPRVASRDDLEAVLDRFEREWRAGAPPRIEDFLTAVSDDLQGELLHDLIDLDMHYRSLRGDVVLAEDYRNRFAERLPATIVQRCDPSRIDWRRPPVDELPPALRPILDIWPFSDLPWHVLRELAAALELRTYDAGEILIRQGEPNRELIVILSGDAEILLRADGREQTLVPAPNVNVLGEIGLLTTRISTVSVVAATPVVAATLPAPEFHRFARRFPVLRTAMLQLMARRFGGHESDALVGKIMHGYRILRCVGHGGMATVYEAEEVVSGAHVALKMMSHGLVDNPGALARFQRELQLNRSLQHPGLLTTLGNFGELGTQFIVLEYCDQANLADVIRSRPLDQQTVRRITGQLAAVVAWLHARGICHRDLKPANVLFKSHGILKLADLGLAWSAECTDLTGQSDVLGTPSYMAPEQLQGGRVDVRADLFAFGCILWEMLTGGRLFRGSSVLEILHSQASFKLPAAQDIRPDLDPQLYAALSQALASDPQRRDVDLHALARWAGPFDETLVH